MFYVYVLKSQKRQTRYIGYTTNLEKRVSDHNANMSRYTKNKGPWDMIYSEAYQSKSEAIRRERFLKTGKGRELLDDLAK